jgi:hypothetical protein
MSSLELLLPGESLLLYGGTNAGKTTQLRKLIEAQATPERKARVNVTDRGGTTSILQPLVAKGICELEIYDETTHDALIWIDRVCQGQIWREGKWIDGECERLSLWATESLSGCGDLTLNALGVQAANGFNVGGEPAPALKIQAQGQTLLVPSGSRTHYLVAQRLLLAKVWQSQNLPCAQVWTSHEDIVPLDKKHADGERTVEIAASLGIKGIIGPMVAGSALTSNLPKYFVFTFRLAVIPADTSNKHVLFTGRHKDGSLEGLANARCEVPVMQNPTDVVAMLKKIRENLK